MLYALNICYAQCKCNFLIVSMTIISYVFMDPNVLYHNVVKIFLKRNIHILMFVLQDRRYLKTGRLKRSQISILFLSIKNLRRRFDLFTYISIDYLSLHLLQITAVGGYISIRVVTVRTSNRLIDNIVPNCY